MFFVIALYFLIGISFGALAVGLILQAINTGNSLTQGFFFIVGLASGVTGLRVFQPWVSGAESPLQGS